MSTLIHTFTALSDSTRLAVVEKLMTEGEQPVGALLNDVTMSAPAMSRHLKVLREAGLIQQRAEGTRRLYSVRPEALRTISDWVMDYRTFWEAGMDRLEIYLACENGDE